MKLEGIFKTLGIPLALIAVIVALLAWAGLTLEQIYTVALSLVGLQLLGVFVVDALKRVGAVAPGAAGVWSAGFQLGTLILTAVYLKFFPTFDIHAADLQLYEFVKVLSLVFAYVVQIRGAQAVYNYAKANGLAYSFSYS